VFIAECTLDAVVVDDKGLKALKGYSSKNMALQTIKGACIKQLGASTLCQFCINNKIEGYPGNKTKLQYCDMIVERKQHGIMDEGMYLKEFEEEKETLMSLMMAQKRKELRERNFPGKQNQERLWAMGHYTGGF
jgi:hypothetical protein